jgi:hypothetical protein
VQTALRRTIHALYATFGVGLLVMFATGRSDGVGEFPALQRRTSYELHNHGARTPVSLAYVAMVVICDRMDGHGHGRELSALHRTSRQD